MIKPGWTFPLNDGGQETGLNDAGIETFMDNPLSSLAREILQNSKDAAPDNAKKPVEVHFTHLDLPIADFPGLKELKASIDACASISKDDKSVAFFKHAKKVLGSPTISVLKISDYNTTGLTVGKADRASAWFRLTKAVGTSDKHAGKLGSFGIGKNAPYACSDLRTVFYGTKDTTGAVAFQGVAKLISHFAAPKKITQGPGYFGVKNGHRPMLTFDAVPEIFGRKNIGADVYIMGFHDYPDWEAKIIKSVIESFFLAIHDETLIVKVGKTKLNKLSLPVLIKKYYAEHDPKYYADEQYAALISESSHVFEEADFCGHGAIRLKVLEGKDFRRRVAMFRRSGMKIYDKGQFRTPLRFSGVFTVEGQSLDAFLRSLEPPSHKAWEEERGSDPAKSKQVLRTLSAWVNDKVRELVSSEELTEVDAEGISQFLPDDIDDALSGTPQPKEKINEEPKEKLEMRVRRPLMNTAPIYDPEEPGPGTDDDSEPGPTPDPGPNPGPGPGPNPQPPFPGPGGGNGAKSIEIKNVRIYCSDSSTGAYRLLFEPSSDEAAYLRVFIIGEVGSEPAPVKSVSINGSKEISKFAAKGLIGPLTLPKGKRAALDVVLENSLRCALGVSAHAS